MAKMPGESGRKICESSRAAYGFMMAHPGKKLLFMGQDIAEFDEWNENRSVEWELLQYDQHKQMQEYVKKLNSMYRNVRVICGG